MLILCQLVFFLLIDQARTSSIQVRAERSFFDFFSKAGHYLIDTEVPKIFIPDITIPINDGPGNGSVSATNLKISKFLTPHIDFQLGDDGILWQSYGGAVKISGDWAAQYAIILPFYENGWVKSVAVGLNVTLAASVYMSENKPQFHIAECLAAIDDLTVEIGGGVVPWLINLFRASLSSAIRSIINKQACVAAETIFLIQANDFIKSLPSRIKFGKDYYADYSLDDDPRFTKNYVEADMSADIVYGDVTCKTDHPLPWTKPGPNPKMITVWMSDSIPNCLLRSAHQADVIYFKISKDMVEVQPYLRTSCSFLSICMGKFFPELKKKYPDTYVDLIFHTYTDPLIIFEKDDIRANITFAVDMHINPNSRDEPLARLVLQTSSSVAPLIQGHKVIGTLNDTMVELRQEFSKIGNMSSTFLSVFGNIFKMSTKVLINTILATGMPIPIMDNVTISDDSEIAVLDKHIRLNIDFKLE